MEQELLRHKSDSNIFYGPSFFGLLFAAFLLRLIALMAGRSWKIPVTLEYGQIADNIIAGKGFAFDFYGLRNGAELKSFFPPFYPYLMVFSRETFDHPYLYLLILQIILSVITCALIFFISREFFSRRASLIAMGLASFYPPFIISSATSFYPLTCDIFMIALSVLLIIRCSKNFSMPVALYAGVSLGIMTLSYPQALIFIPFAILYWRMNKSSYVLRKGLILVCLYIIIIIPWCIRNYQEHGRITNISTNGGFNFWMGNNPFTMDTGWDVDVEAYKKYIGGREPDPAVTRKDVPDKIKSPAEFQSFVTSRTRAYLPNEIRERVGDISETELESLLYKAGIDYVLDEPLLYVKRVATKCFYFWIYRPPEGRKPAFASFPGNVIYIVHYMFLFPLAAGGIYVSRKKWRELSFIFFILILFTALYANFFVLSRYRWLIDGFLMVLAGAFLDNVVENRDQHCINL